MRDEEFSSAFRCVLGVPRVERFFLRDEGGGMRDEEFPRRPLRPPR
jgi:hypothetical protein